MCWGLKAQPVHLVLLQVSFVLSLFSSFCCCTLSHRHPIGNYYYNYNDNDYYSPTSSSIRDHEEDIEMTRNYYQKYDNRNDNDDHDELSNFMDDGMEQSEAVAPSSSGYKLISVDDYLGPNQDNADHNQVII